MTVYIVITPVIFIIIAVVSIINMCCKTFMSIMLTWKDTTEAVHWNYSIFSPFDWQCHALLLLDTSLKVYRSSGNK